MFYRPGIATATAQKFCSGRSAARITACTYLLALLCLLSSSSGAQDTNETQAGTPPDTGIPAAAAQSDEQSQSANLPLVASDLDLFERKVEIYARIVQTYGLAVFLVLFYVLVVWRKQNQDRDDDRKERTKWIEQITALRVMVDPSAKRLTRDQARTIMQMAIAGHVDMLTANRGSDGGIGGPPPGLGFGASNEREFSIHLFGQEIPVGTSGDELQSTLHAVGSAIESRVDDYKDMPDKMIRFLEPYHQRVALRLDSLLFGAGSLGPIFRKAFSAAAKAAKDAWHGLPEYSKWDLDNARRDLLARIKDVDSRNAVEEFFRNVQFASENDLVITFRNTFENEADGLLGSADMLALT